MQLIVDTLGHPSHMPCNHNAPTLCCAVFCLSSPLCNHAEVLSKVDSVKKLDPSNAALMATLHPAFSHNMGAINFWLRFCVFPGDTQQYPQRLMTTAWHLTATPGAAPATGAAAAAGGTSGSQSEAAIAAQPAASFVVGFSGTKDNHRLLPATVRQKQLPDPQLAGTDGRMLATLLNPAAAAGYITLPMPADGQVRHSGIYMTHLCTRKADLSCDPG
jgi:hypothetical protein